MGPAVLVVDDDASVLNTVKRIIKMHDIDVDTVETGDACIQKLREGFKGVVLVDIVMPEMDGWDTIQAAVEGGLTQHVIFIMLTGREVPDAKMDYLKEYVLDYITKPFDAKKLVSVVKEYLAYLK
jgi:DNA-binding response OmpR family regulator